MWNGQSAATLNDIPQDNKMAINKKRLIMAIVLTILVAVIILVVFLFVFNDGLPNYDNTQKVEALLNDEEATPSTIITELDFILEEKGASEYIDHFQTVIDSINDDELKAEYYLARARGLFDYGSQNGNVDVYREQILADAKEAEGLAPSIGSAYALYIYESAFGEGKLATYYEKLFDERSTENLDAED